MQHKFTLLLGCLVLLLVGQIPVAAVHEVGPVDPAAPASTVFAQLPSAAAAPEAAGVAAETGQIIWGLTVVDEPGNVGQYTSLWKDADGRPHISFYDVTDGALKYAALDGTTWSIETVDTTSNTGLYTSLALDAANRPHISYYDQTNGDLRYARYVATGGNCGVTNPGAWQCDLVDGTGDVGQYASLELDAQDYAHISYYDTSNLHLKYAYEDGSGWQVETVDATDKVGTHASLALDAAGDAHISYYDGTFTNGDLKYAHSVGEGQGNCGPLDSWECVLIDTAGLHGLHTSIALDGAGTPHISYFGANSVRYASPVGSGGNCGPASDWQCGTIILIGGGATNGHTSLAIDENDRPYIAYHHVNGNQLQYAYGVAAGSGNCGPGQAWQCEVVDPALGTGLFNAIALDSVGQPGISYYDPPNGNLMYADGTLCVPIQQVTIAGPLSLEVGEAGVYTATYVPPAASLPITMSWSNATVGVTATYAFADPGLHTIIVTATNPCSVVTSTLTVSVCQPVTGVEIAGPTFLPVAEVGTYTATYLPLTATLPVTITWDNGTVGSAANYSWTMPGVYTITVTATNPCDVVSATQRVTVALTCQPLSSVTAIGPGLLRVGETGIYTASYEPPDAQMPVTIAWDDGTIGTTAAYSWTSLGQYTILVTATNPCNWVTDTLAVSVCQPVTTVQVDGPTYLDVEEVGTYTATSLPLTATLPVTITWDNGTVGATANYSWTVPGIYTRTVTATNPCATIVGTFVVAVATCRPVSTVELIGPVDVIVGGVVVYTATVSPVGATPPLTITWDNGSSGATAAYSWTTPGPHTVMVSATNPCGEAADSLAVSVCGPVQDAAMAWAPSSPLAGRRTVFTGTATGTTPISYTWNVDNITLTGPVVAYTFTVPGSYAVTLTAVNHCGEDVVRQDVWVSRPHSQEIYLPMVFRNWDPCAIPGTGYWESEPNDSFATASGPLCSGASYFGYTLWDDYWYFRAHPGLCTVRLDNPDAQHVQILLYTPLQERIGWDNRGEPVLQITAELTLTGDYFLRVYADLEFTRPYTLQITFP